MPTSALAEPELTFDPVLPISARVDEIATTIRDNQVVIVAGETGSGKTTQLPKICLQLGRAAIAHTQPRRIAARTTAERIAEEMAVPLGDLVGYQVRFTRKASQDTQLKVMTDGVLLAEIGRDRDLSRYDTIILDEAHERSLNIDFLLGYLKQLLSRRRDLKVIITSATIDTQRFAEHFTGPDGDPAPIIEVSGRNYPVEVRYRPLVGRAGSEHDDQHEDLDQDEGICRAAAELVTTGGDGDILVFLSGEREIRDATEALQQAQQSWLARQLRRTEILPLYARLSAAEQHRVFTSHTGRRIVLATNVAETSLTVPGIRYVIDTGTARISRYSARTKVQRLPIEPISKASADQRAGRCGRVAPGICIRLYDEEDYQRRADFTEPEILRTNLASVILQMASAGLGDIATFPFVEAPDAAQINDGLRLLKELGAIATSKNSRSRHRGKNASGSGGGPRLTGIGRKLAGIPVDPRLARMMLAGERQGCLNEVLVIVAGLSVQDPRERPADHRDAADALHRRFWAPMEGLRPELADDSVSPELVAESPELGAKSPELGAKSPELGAKSPELVEGRDGPSTGSGREKAGSGRGKAGSGTGQSPELVEGRDGPSTGSGREKAGSGTGQSPELVEGRDGPSTGLGREKASSGREKAGSGREKAGSGTGQSPELVEGRDGPSTGSGREKEGRDGPSTGSGRGKAGSGTGQSPELVEGRDGPSTGSGREKAGSGREKAGSGRGKAGSGRGKAGSGGEKAGSGAEATGDFIALLRLWDYLRQQQRARSGNGFRRMCRDEYLHFLRVREWQDLHAQLRQIARDLKLTRNDGPAGPEAIHTAILTGLLSQVGLAEVSEDNRGQRSGKRGRRPKGPREYLGARGTRFAINPGSSLAKVNPPLVMAAEITETSRLWARTVGPVDAAQIEEVAGHLLKHTYSEPHWSARNGSVMAYEQVSLYGVPIIGRRRVSYGNVNPAEAREIFIRSALVEGDWRTRHQFFADNQALRGEAAELEERTRRRDLVADDQAIFDFYDARIPADVTSAAAFDRWWKTARERDPDLLRLTMADLVADPAAAHTDQFPDHLRAGGIDWRVHYTFDPASNRDGVTVEIPLSQLNQADPAAFSWQVPGLRGELATELVKSLPKAVRRSFVPAHEHASRALTWLADHPNSSPESFPQALGRALRMLTGEEVPSDAWFSTAPPARLLPTFVIVDDHSGDELAVGKDLPALKQQLAPRLATALDQAADRITRHGATSWVFDTLDDHIEAGTSTAPVLAYPGLVDEGDTVGLKAYDTKTGRDRGHPRGLRRLVMINTPDPTRWVAGRLAQADKLVLAGGPYPDLSALLADARAAAVDRQIRGTDLGPVRDENTFARLCDLVRADAADCLLGVVGDAVTLLREWQQAGSELDGVDRIDPAAAADLSDQLGNLIFPGFLGVTDAERLPDLVRYLTAARRRIGVLRASPGKDGPGQSTIAQVEDAYGALCDQMPPGPLPADVDAIGWMLEELRVSLFAQSLRTRYPISAKRVLNAISEARQAHGLAPPR